MKRVQFDVKMIHRKRMKKNNQARKKWGLNNIRLRQHSSGSRIVPALKHRWCYARELEWQWECQKNKRRSYACRVGRFTRATRPAWRTQWTIRVLRCWEQTDEEEMSRARDVFWPEPLSVNDWITQHVKSTLAPQSGSGRTPAPKTRPKGLSCSYGWRNERRQP